MTDIVERLRTFPNSTQREHDLQREAADEIERLRERLKIARCPHCGTDYTLGGT